MPKINKKILFAFCLALLAAGALIFPLFSQAQTKLVNPLTGNESPIAIEDLAARIIRGVLGIIGAIALAMFIYGGITLITAAGNSSSIKKGWTILIWAVLGLAVIFTSYTALNFILGGLQGTASSPTTTIIP